MFFKKALGDATVVKSEEEKLVAQISKNIEEKKYEEASTLLEKGLAKKGQQQSEIVKRVKNLCSFLWKNKQEDGEILTVVASMRQKISLAMKPQEQKIVNNGASSQVPASDVKDAKQNPMTTTMKKPPEGLVVENLCFQGGGVKGIAYLGAMQALSQYIDVKQVKRYAGTSAGAITSVLLAVGTELEEIDMLLRTTPFTEFMDGNYRDTLLKLIQKQTQDALKENAKKAGEVSGTFQQSTWPHNYASASSQASSLASDPHLKLIKEGIKELKAGDNGLFPGDVLREWIEERLQEKTGIPYITFGELHELAKKEPAIYKDVYLMAADISGQAPQVLCHEQEAFSNVIISDAVRASVSIPLVFRPCQLHVKSTFDTREVHAGKHWYVDGGLLENYALALFDKPEYLPKEQKEMAGNGVYGVRNPRSLGLRLVNKEEKEKYEGESKKDDMGKAPDGLGSFLWAVMMTVYHRQEVLHVERQEIDRTIYIDHQGISPVQFNLSHAEQELLKTKGREAVETYFEFRKKKTAETDLAGVSSPVASVAPSPAPRLS